MARQGLYLTLAILVGLPSFALMVWGVPIFYIVVSAVVASALVIAWLG